MAGLIRRALAISGLAQKVIAIDFGVSTSTVSRWVSGESEAPLPVLAYVLRLAPTPAMAAAVVEAFLGVSGTFDDESDDDSASSR